MSEINQLMSKSMTTTRTTASDANGLSLYDQYGAVAYGVILQIVPQPQPAQEILIDLFASPDLRTALSAASNKVCTLVRLARIKALDYRQKQQLPVVALPTPDNQSELIFNLLFYQNQTPEAIAERLQIDRTAVFAAIREVFAHTPPA